MVKTHIVVRNSANLAFQENLFHQRCYMGASHLRWKLLPSKSSTLSMNCLSKVLRNWWLWPSLPGNLVLSCTCDRLSVGHTQFWMPFQIVCEGSCCLYRRLQRRLNFFTFDLIIYGHLQRYFHVRFLSMSHVFSNILSIVTLLVQLYIALVHNLQIVAFSTFPSGVSLSVFF